MQVQELNPNSFADLFPSPSGDQKKQGGLSFGMEETFQDILKVDETPDNQDDTKGGELGVKEQKKDIEEQLKDDLKESANNTDLTQVDKKEDEKPKELKEISDFFSQRIQEGKFVAINEVDDKGNKVAFIPKTFDDLEEAINLQIDYKLEDLKKGLDQQWYESKSGAWKAVAQYAEMTDDPTHLIPFLEGVKTIQSVEAIDENEIDGAEQIVRVRMERAGDPDDVIESQIEALKSTDKLIATAKQYKPMIVNQEKQSLQQQVRQRELEEQAWAREINDIRTKAYQEIEKPFFGKTVLKKEEKAAIFNLIAQPSEETKGFAIYDEIDRLFAKRDFETLKQIALLVSKKDSFFNYVGVDVANQTAGKLQRKLQAATESRSSSGHDYTEEKTPSITRSNSGPLKFSTR